MFRDPKNKEDLENCEVRNKELAEQRQLDNELLREKVRAIKLANDKAEMELKDLKRIEDMRIAILEQRSL